jgi:hypothetical protein
LLEAVEAALLEAVEAALPGVAEAVAGSRLLPSVLLLRPSRARGGNLHFAFPEIPKTATRAGGESGLRSRGFPVQQFLQILRTLPTPEL